MKSMTTSIRRWTTILALGASMCGAAQAALLYNQAPRVDGTLYLSVADAQNADSFQLSYAASITGVRWYGTDLDVAEFVVRFYGGSLVTGPDTYTTQSGVPGSTLTRSIAPIFSVSSGPVTLPIYEYELTLASAYATAADQQVYIALFSSGDDWGWLDSAEGDGQSAFRGADTTPWNTSPPDLSLSVIGDRVVAGVPEPTSLALVGLALAAAASARRRKT